MKTVTVLSALRREEGLALEPRTQVSPRLGLTSPEDPPLRGISHLIHGVLPVFFLNILFL